MNKLIRHIVMDTNILFSGLYSNKGASHQILRLIHKNKIKLALSTTLLFEYEDVLKRNKLKLKLSEKNINIILDNLSNLSNHHQIYFLWRPFLPDAKDDYVLELAVSSEIKVIVTYNIKDFTGIKKFGVRAITPKKLLEELK